MLTPEQRADWEQRGYVLLPAAFPSGAAAAMCEQVWAALARRHGIERERPETWNVEEPRRLQALRRARAFDAIATPALCSALDELLGAGAWWRPAQWGSPLLTFPRGGAWDVPHRRWHFDWPVCGATEPPIGVKLLAFLAPVVPQGGGTLVLAGSHRLVARSIVPGEPARQGRVLRRALFASHQWLGEIASADGGSERVPRLMHGAVIDGVAVRVVELTGDAGDVVLFHPWMLHAAGPNCSQRPRLMVGENLQTARGLALYAGSGAEKTAVSFADASTE